MKKLALSMVAGALLLSACGAGDAEVAATVNGTDYTVGDVNGLVFDDGETMSKDQFAQFLGFLIQYDIVVNAAEEDYDVSFTDEEIADQAMTIYELNAEEGVTYEEFLEANAVSEDFVERVAELQLVEEGVGEVMIEEIEPPTAEEIEAQREAAYDNLTEVCVSHILVETEEEAGDVIERVEDGEDFADLAVELSTDQGSGAEGGDLGCTSPTRYVPEFMDATLEAKIGELFGPVETQFGFHVLIVNERTFPEDDELPTDEEIIDSTKSSELPAALNTWIGGHLEDAEVTVNEKYGTWRSSPAGVVPPSDDNETTTTVAPGDSTTTTVGEPTEETTTTSTGDQ